MSNMVPVAVYGLKVPAGDVMIPATAEFPATFRITMAAIDPSAKPEHTGTANGDTPARATLKLVYDPHGPGGDDSSEEDSEDEENYLKALLEGKESADGGDDDSEDDDEDDELSSDEEEKNGGPSDPSKTKKARQNAALQQMMETLAESNDESDEDVDMNSSPKANGVVGKSKSNKGKGKALAGDSDDDVDEDDSEASLSEDMDEQVVCTLDPTKNYQQPLDITIPEDQRAYFKVSGTHAIYLTGNYVIPADEGQGHKSRRFEDDDDDSEYDMSPDDDELELIDEDESDELDNMKDPRITEVGSDDEEEPPKLITKDEPTKKGKNKRAHEDSSEVEPTAVNLDDMIKKSLKPTESAANGASKEEPKLSKKQLKKLKNNAGKAVEAAIENKNVKKDDVAKKEDENPKGDKKVQFAKNLEQGPSASPSTLNETAKDDEKPKATLGKKIISGITIDDKKLGKGPVAKKGSKVSMRYIGKLKNSKVFDSNKKGKPFSFTLGEGSVIKGWDIGVPGMSAGGERRIIVPAEMAYGKKGAPPDIPPNSELTFDVKMLEVK